MQMVQRLDVSGSEAIESIVSEGLRYSPACEETYKSRPGFYKTERGKRHFSLNLQQISDSVHTTCYFGVLHAMLSGKSHYQQYHQKFGQQVLRANDLMQTERRRFMIAQKSKNGIYVMDAEIKHMMRQEGVVPNVYVVPDKFGIYISMVSGDALEYKEQGNKALVNREYADKGLTFRGTKCFEAQSFDVEFNSQPVDLLTRRQQVGSWYVLPAKSGGDSGDRYIYSADSDSFEKISRAEAWKHIVNKGNDNKAVTTVNEEAGNLVQVDPKMVNQNNQYMMKEDGKEPEEWTGTLEDSDILLFRPNQTFNASSAILAKGGSELGNTYHGHHDFMLSDDVVRKVHKYKFDRNAMSRIAISLNAHVQKSIRLIREN